MHIDDDKDICAMRKDKEYYAFISYKSEDVEWAIWLQHELEHYHLPASFNGQTDIPQELRPVFRDIDELSAGNLPEQIYRALENSQNLIVVCSPQAAVSPWVNQEVEIFISLGRTKRIFPFIVEGNSPKDFFPPALLNLPPEEERLGGDVNKNGRDAAFVKVVAGMLNIGFDSLWNRYEKDRIRKEQREREDKEKLQRIESLYISEHVDSVSECYGLFPAIKLLLGVLPQRMDNLNRPYVVETESKLIDLYHEYMYGSYHLVNTITASSVIFNNHTNEILVINKDQSLQLLDISTYKCSRTILEGDKIVVSVLFLQDGKIILVKRPNDTIIFSKETLLEIDNPIEGYCVAVCDNGSMIVCITSDRKINLYNIKTKSKRVITHKYIDNYVSLTFSSDGKNILFLNKEGLLCFYEILTDKVSWRQLFGFHCEDWGISLNLCGNKLIVTARNTIIGVWNIENCKKIDSWLLYKTFITKTSDGKIIITEDQGKIQLWNTERKKTIIKELTGHIRCFNPHKNQIIICDSSGNSYLFDIKSLTLSLPMSLPIVDYDDIFPTELKLTVSPCGRYIAIPKHSETQFWEIGSNKNIYKTINEEDVQSIAISSDGRLLATGTWNKTIKIWDIKQEIQIGHTLKEHSYAIMSVNFNLNGTLLVSGSADNTICIWDMFSYNLIGLPLKHDGMIITAQFSNDDKRVVSVARDNTIRIWDIVEYKEIKRIELFHYDIYAFSPNGNYLLAGCYDNIIRLFSINTCNIIGEIAELDLSDIRSINFTLDSTRIYIVLGNNTFYIFNVDKCEKINQQIQIKGSNITFSNDGKKVITSNDNKLSIIDVESGNVDIKQLSNYSMSISHIILTPDNKRVVVGENNGRLSLYDLESCLQIGKSLIHQDVTTNMPLNNPIELLKFSNNGETLIVKLHNGEIRIFEYLSTQALIDKCTKIIGNEVITETERERYSLRWGIV